MWFIGVEVEQETSEPPPKKNPGSAPAEGEWFTSFSSVFPTSQVGHHAGKTIESVVYCFYKIKFTGTINHRFLTNRAYYLSYQL